MTRISLALLLALAGCNTGIVTPGFDESELRCDKNPGHLRCDGGPPTVTISDPQPGATVSGIVVVGGLASDDRVVVRVEARVDQGAYQLCSGTVDWSCALDTAGLVAGAHSLTARATDRAGNGAEASVAIGIASPTTTRESPPAPSYGPQASITCPAGAINISSGQNIPSIVAANPEGATFCVMAGTHSPTSPINLKPNQKLIGQYGAIIDGRNVTMTYDISSTSIVRGWNCGSCAGGTVRNLVLRNLATHSCIGVFGAGSDNWTLDHNEVHGCKTGINVGANSGARITHNYIHNNVGDPSSPTPSLRGGGYGSYLGSNMLFEDNQIAYNGPEQKVAGSTNVVFRRNYVHHNNDGIWYDGDNTGSLIEDNVVEDHAREGIFYEISGSGIIRNNIVRRSVNSGIFISTSKDAQIYGNRLEDNGRGIQYFLNCSALGGGNIGWDLANNNSHDNIIKVGTASGSFANTFSYLSNCSSTQLAPYLNGSKGLIYAANRYYVPSTSGRYWFWSGYKLWSEWQAVPQDAGSTLQPASEYTGSSGGVSSSGPDVSPPSISIANPPESSTVWGTVTIEASASDNVGVVGVQFRVDGVNVGAEDTTAPYSLPWNTAGFANGNHTLTAVARDEAGNLGASSANTVNVSN